MTAPSRTRDQPGELVAALGGLGLQPPRPVWWSSGAGGLGPADLDRLRPWSSPALLRITRLGLDFLDGGTWSGVMWLFGEVRSDADLDFPSLGWPRSGR